MRALTLALMVSLLAWLPGGTRAQGADWGGFAMPSPAPSHAVGTYSNGCLLGGAPLPPEGAGYQVVRLTRERYYGHPALIDYLVDLGTRAEAAGLGPILVADLSAPRGGPLSGHASHEIGLDADVWLRLGVPELSRAEREGLPHRGKDVGLTVHQGAIDIKDNQSEPPHSHASGSSNGSSGTSLGCH